MFCFNLITNLRSYNSSSHPWNFMSQLNQEKKHIHIYRDTMWMGYVYIFLGSHSLLSSDHRLRRIHNPHEKGKDYTEFTFPQHAFRISLISGSSPASLSYSNTKAKTWNYTVQWPQITGKRANLNIYLYIWTHWYALKTIYMCTSLYSVFLSKWIVLSYQQILPDFLVI